MTIETKGPSGNGQYKLPLGGADSGAPMPSQVRDASTSADSTRYVLHVSADACAALQALAEAHEKPSINAWAACADLLWRGIDAFPVGDKVGAPLRGFASTIDAFVDPVSLVRRPIHKRVKFVSDGNDGFRLVLGSGQRGDVKRGSRFGRTKRTDERLVG